MGQRRAEQRHNAVTHDLVHGALIAVHRFHHTFQHRVEELPRLLGVAIGEELQRALHVGEEHRHLLALPFQRRAGGENLFR